jgi:hypothetical protein
VPSTDSCVQQDRTFIGRIERGFDFLGYHFSPTGLRVAKKTIAYFIEKASKTVAASVRASLPDKLLAVADEATK